MTDATEKYIFIAAGDVSGDIHAARLIRALKAQDPSLRIACIGGKNMQACADEFLCDLASQGIAGFIEPLKKIPQLIGLMGQVKNFFRTHRTIAFIAVDFYGLNRRFLGIAKKENIPAYYYVTPQVWASRQYRAKKLANLTRKMYVIYPFEPDFHKKFGGNAVFLGNPLLDNMPAPLDKNYAISNPKTHAWKLGLLPGSRMGEITRLTPVFYQAFKQVCAQFPNTQAYLFLLPDADENLFINLMGEQPPKNFHFVKEKDYKLRAQMDYLLACSGTATLENALLGVPMLVAYRLLWATYYIARAIIQVPYISLVNILSGKFVVKEFIQDDATADNCAKETIDMFSHPEKLTAMRGQLLQLRASLGEKGVAERAAKDLLADIKQGDL